jgi:hypothetical protein
VIALKEFSLIDKSFYLFGLCMLRQCLNGFAPALDSFEVPIDQLPEVSIQELAYALLS